MVHHAAYSMPQTTGTIVKHRLKMKYFDAFAGAARVGLTFLLESSLMLLRCQLRRPRCWFQDCWNRRRSVPMEFPMFCMETVVAAAFTVQLEFLMLRWMESMMRIARLWLLRAPAV